MFVVSIIVATYGLVAEKQIAIEFVRKELVGARYMEALRGVYAAILTENRDAPPSAPKTAINASLDALFTAEADTAGSLNTAEFEQSVATARNGLYSRTTISGLFTLPCSAASEPRIPRALRH
jgi:hypothetical protein